MPSVFTLEAMPNHYVVNAHLKKINIWEIKYIYSGTKNIK